MLTFRCRCPWDSLTVWVDGYVSHCGRTKPLGRLVDRDFDSFWNSPELQRMRGLFRQDALLQAGCMPTCNILMSKRPDEFVPNQIARSEFEPIADDDIAREETTERPSYMLLQLSDFCSLGCRMCCYGEGDDLRAKLQKSGTIDAKILDNLRSVWPSVTTLDILGGELFDLPFDGHPLHRLFADLAEFGNPRLAVKIVTNGKNLDERWARWLMQFEFVDAISFSLDSADPDVYPKIRVRGSLNRSLENLARIVRLRNAHGDAKPRVLVTALIGNHTAPGILHLANVAKELGADRLDLQPMNQMGDAQYHFENNIFQARFAPEMRRLLADLARLDFPSNRADVIGMIESFLRTTGDWEGAVRSDPSIPQVAQCHYDAVVGPLVRGSDVVQPFIARRPEVTRARLVFATYGRTNTEPIEVRIEGVGGRVLTSVSLLPQELRDNEWHDIEFPASPIDVGERYFVRIRSPRSTARNCVSLRASAAGDDVCRVGETERQQKVAMILF